jgi:hypothetical protein
MKRITAAASLPQTGQSPLRRTCSIGVVATAILLCPQASRADQDGVSMWLPGFYGSLAAVPLQPGVSLTTIYYHTSVSAGADVAIARERTLNRIPVNLTLAANLSADLSSRADLGLAILTYVPPFPILGGQASFGLMGVYGRVDTSLEATLSGTLSGTFATSMGTIPLGSLPFSRSDSLHDVLWGFGDLYPQFSLRWNAGVNNYMVYLTGDVPVGAYDPSRLSNTGIGHGAVDGGFGYTYFNPQTGQEFSGVLGFTYNTVNQSTDYQNGVDMHFDWGASQFLSKQLMVGLVGYVYKEIGCDSGSGNRVGCFQSQVVGVGPQLGFIIPAGGMQAYLNFKGYGEFAAENRPHGWNAWVTLSLSPAAPSAPPTRRRR